MSDPLFRTVLVPDKQSLALPIGCSVLFHVGLALSAWLFRGVWAVLFGLLAMLFPFCSEPQPLIQDSIEVSMVSLPKSERNVPDRAARVQRAVGQPSPTPPPEPPPVKESDLAVKTKKPPPPKPGNTAEDLKRQELLDALQRDAALQDLLAAPDGPVDRNATDPNGTGDINLAVLQVGAQGDPAYARWYAQVQRLIQDRFKPVGTDRSLRARGRIQVDPETGKVLSTTLSERSGVISFDSAAERAMQTLGTIPLPPDKYRPLLKDPITFDFEPP